MPLLFDYPPVSTHVPPGSLAHHARDFVGAIGCTRCASRAHGRSAHCFIPCSPCKHGARLVDGVPALAVDLTTQGWAPLATQLAAYLGDKTRAPFAVFDWRDAIPAWAADLQQLANASAAARVPFVESLTFYAPVWLVALLHVGTSLRAAGLSSRVGQPAWPKVLDRVVDDEQARAALLVILELTSSRELTWESLLTREASRPFADPAAVAAFVQAHLPSCLWTAEEKAAEKAKRAGTRNAYRGR